MSNKKSPLIGAFSILKEISSVKVLIFIFRYNELNNGAKSGAKFVL